MTEACAH